jgi:hypothetical protein
MELVRTERQFRIASPAAVDNHGTSARLSCHAPALPNAFEVWISASLDQDGGWTVSHLGGLNSAMVPSARMIMP